MECCKLFAGFASFFEYFHFSIEPFASYSTLLHLCRDPSDSSIAQQENGGRVHNVSELIQKTSFDDFDRNVVNEALQGNLNSIQISFKNAQAYRYVVWTSPCNTHPSSPVPRKLQNLPYLALEEGQAVGQNHQNQ